MVITITDRAPAVLRSQAQAQPDVRPAASEEEVEVSSVVPEDEELQRYVNMVKYEIVEVMAPNGRDEQGCVQIQPEAHGGVEHKTGEIWHFCTSSCGFATLSEEKMKNHWRKHLEMHGALENIGHADTRKRIPSGSLLYSTMARKRSMDSSHTCDKGGQVATNAPLTPRIKIFTCRLCRRLFTLRRARETHMARVHGVVRRTVQPITNNEASGSTTFACDFCPRSFTLYRAKLTHMERTHGIAEWTTTDRPNNDHAVDEASLKFKPFNCWFCPRTFSIRRARYDHMERHIQQVGDNNVSRRAALQAAIAKSKETQMEFERNQCPICEKTFAMDYIGQHIETVHLGVKKYPCGQCGIKFGRPYEVNMHSARKHIGKEYACEFCSCTFGKIYMKTRHINRYHGPVSQSSTTDES